MGQVYIEQLIYYPVKSCAGITLKQAELTEYGIVGDRQWMIVDEHGTMITQRKLPQLALLQAYIEYDQLYLRHPEAPGAIPLQIPTHAESKNVSIWRDKVSAFRADDAMNRWLNTYIHYSSTLSLVCFNPSLLRQPGQPERFGHTGRHFSDAAPFLICNQASLDSLNSHLQNENIALVTHSHFRPNIVISGLEAFAEQRTSTLSTYDSSMRLELVDPCQRCIMITINPQTGIKDTKRIPFLQLSKINTMPNSAAPAFGMNARLVLQHAESTAKSVWLKLGQVLNF